MLTDVKLITVWYKETRMTKELAFEITANSSRCTQAMLRAFGVEGYPLKGSGCLSYLTEAGYSLTIQDLPRMTLRHWYAVHMDWNKDYLLFTNGHAMACRSGVLIDTQRQDFNGRIVEQSFVVELGG